MAQYKYTDYICRIVVELDKSNVSVNDSPPTWWKKPNGMSDGIPFHTHIQRSIKKNIVLLGGPEITPAQFIDYLQKNIEFYTNDICTGGIEFLDISSGNIIPTNYDLGETEEWGEIISNLQKAKKAFHTFSATDAAIELQLISEDVVLQNLSWSAMPRGIENSKLTASKHIFIDKNKFLAELNNCICWWTQTINILKNLRRQREDILTLISVDARRKTSLST
jgi:hypothetical protein